MEGSVIKRLVTAGLLVGMFFAPSAVPSVFAQNEVCSYNLPSAEFQACLARNQRAQDEKRERERAEAQRQREREEDQRRQQREREEDRRRQQRERQEDQQRQDQQRREDQDRREREARQRR